MQEGFEPILTGRLRGGGLGLGAQGQGLPGPGERSLRSLWQAGAGGVTRATGPHALPLPALGPEFQGSSESLLLLHAPLPPSPRAPLPPCRLLLTTQGVRGCRKRTGAQQSHANDPGRIITPRCSEASQTGPIAPLYLLSVSSTHLLRLGCPLAAMACPFMAGPCNLKILAVASY